MLGRLAKAASAGLLLLSTALPASAELRQGPTGVEYVRRFEPSPGIASPGCYFVCPNARDAPEPAPGVPPKSSAGEGSTTASSGDTQLPGLYTQCEYPGIQYVGANLNCFYSEDDGTGFLGNQPLACAKKAAVVCPAKTRRRRERDETKLERVVRERQWKGPGKSTTTA